jgi:hypothetical protein
MRRRGALLGACVELRVARVGRDQVEDYAVRRGFDLQTTERWLRPNLD